MPYRTRHVLCKSDSEDTSFVSMRVGHPLYPSATITFYTEPLILHELDTSIM